MCGLIAVPLCIISMLVFSKGALDSQKVRNYESNLSEVYQRKSKAIMVQQIN